MVSLHLGIMSELGEDLRVKYLGMADLGFGRDLKTGKVKPCPQEHH